MLALALVACEPAMDERQPRGAARARAYLSAEIERHRTPGLQYIVVDSAGTRLAYDGGWADVARRVPMESTTTLMAYSMSKTITAVAVLQLVQAGRVGLDDPVDRYVDSLPYGPGITVRQLISHTSGLPNPIPLRWVHRPGDPAFDEGRALAAVLAANPKLSSVPGSKYRYSNIGYWLLGKVVERASGRSFVRYVTDHIFAPLGASPSELGYAIADPARHASGYLEKYSFLNVFKGWLIDRALVGEYAGPWLRIEPHYPNGPAFGGVVGNARGFALFLADELRGHSALLDDSTRALLHTAQRTTAGTPVPMTLGWHMGVLDGTPFFYKEGGGGGFHAMMRVYPTRGIASIVMANATGFDVKRCQNTVDREFLLTARAASAP